MSLLSNPQQSPQENASNFESLHEKITGTEERLTDINDQTQKKFQIIRDNVSPLYITFPFLIVIQNPKTNRRGAF